MTQKTPFIALRVIIAMLCLLWGTSCRHAPALVWHGEDAAVTVTEATVRLDAERLSMRSGPLSLEPLRLYEIAATIACGPGTHHRFEVHYTTASGEQEIRAIFWQFLRASRTDWQPFSPMARRYRQAFILPEGALDVYFQASIEPPRQPAAAPLTTLEITDLQLQAGKSVPFADKLDTNQLFNGDMELPATGTLPAGWITWSDTDGCELVDADDAQSGRHYLRLQPGHNKFLQPGVLAAVPRGTAWRLSFWARGKGSITALVHSLNDDQPPWRVGDAQVRTYPIDTAEWTHHEQVWFAESPALYSAQVVFKLTATDQIDIDTIEFQPYLP